MRLTGQPTITPTGYWLSDTKNWGDVFTPFLFEKAFGVTMDLAPADKAEVFSCGSLLERVPEDFKGHVLGSGMGHEETRLDLRKVKAPLLLRGKLAAKRCKYRQPIRFGDPAILASLFVGHNQKIHRYGVIPHYVDKFNADVIRATSQGVRYIDIEGDILGVINTIASCEMVVSSSLHGLVIADSLGVPNKFVRLSNLLQGGIFKFEDYYSAYEQSADPAPTIEEGFKSCRAQDVSSIRKDVFNVFTEYVAGLV